MFIAYLNLSQDIYEFQYHLGDQYPLYFAGVACSIGLATLLNGSLVRRYGMQRLSGFALSGGLSASLLYSISLLSGTGSLNTFLAFIFVQMFAYGILIGNLHALAMQSLQRNLGLGASIVGGVATLISVPLSLGVAQLHKDASLSLAWGFCGVGILSFTMFLMMNKESQHAYSGN